MKFRCLIIVTMILVVSCQREQTKVQDSYQLETKEYIIQSDILNEDRSHWVYSPPAAQNKPLPVLFILDGSHYFSFFKALMEQWGSKKEIVLPEITIVAIEQKDRSSELLHSYINENGKGELFLSYIENELIPFIDSTYNSLPRRTLFGHSRGGLFALNVLIDKPELFDNYIVSDPNLMPGNMAFLHKWNQSQLNFNSHQNSLFIGLADTREGYPLEVVLDPESEVYPHMRTIWSLCQEIELNEDQNENFDWKYYDGFGHNTVPPMVGMDGLLSVFQYHRLDKYGLIYSHIDNKITYHQFKQKIIDHFAEISEKFGSTVYPYEELIFEYGEIFHEENMDEKAIDMFQWNVENFPGVGRNQERLNKLTDTKQR